MIHKAKKSFSQNFLKSEPALQMMTKAGNVNKEDIILEIGPGKGALTSKLLEKAGKVIAIEKDRDLISILEEKFKDEIENKKLILLNEDILNFEITKLVLEFFSGPRTFSPDHEKNLKPIQYKIIANIPYNITGAILKKFLSEVNQPSIMILLVQKEVAERIVARDNKESILSLSVKAYGKPAYIMKVGKRFFSPSPKVDSAIIAISEISRKNFKNKDQEELFFKIIKTAFAHKRKVLRKNLESIIPSDLTDKMFKEFNIDKKIRAEDLKFPLWLKIIDYLSINI